MNAPLAYQLADDSWTSSVERLVTLGWGLDGVLRAGVPGDVVELGCHAGHASVWLADCLRTAGTAGLSRDLVLFDSFQGLPAPGADDTSPTSAELHRGDLAATEQQVLDRFAEHGLPPPRIVPGWIADTLDQLPDDGIALAYLDLDLFEPTLTGLRAVWPRMSPGGLLVLDDYCDPVRDPRAWNGLPGVKRAADDFLTGLGLPLDAIRVVPGVADYRATGLLHV